MINKTALYKYGVRNAVAVMTCPLGAYLRVRSRRIVYAPYYALKFLFVKAYLQKKWGFSDLEWNLRAEECLRREGL